MSDAKPLYVFFTMDCERVLGREMPEFGTAGPKDWPTSEQSIRRYAQILAEHDLISTYFITAAAATAHSDLFLQLTGKGNELGLHVHAQVTGNLSNIRYDRFLGQYNQTDQLQILTDAKTEWSNAIGYTPTIFRPGNFSGNSQIFDTLTKAGFTAGSVALTGRVNHTYAANWPNWGASARFVGSFLEIPVTAAINPTPQPDGQCNPPHLRIEAQTIGTDQFEQIIADNLTCPCVDPELPRTIAVLTHNCPHTFTDGHYEKLLRSRIKSIQTQAQKHNFALKNTTIDAFRHKVL